MLVARIAIVAVLALAGASSALADSIDGNWCDGKGRQMSIQGPTIVTPGGTTMEGRYSRHAFSYAVPERESPAGAAVSMTLAGETVIRLRVGEGAIETWNRCERTS
jgi:hypothetical protein